MHPEVAARKVCKVLAVQGCFIASRLIKPECPRENEMKSRNERNRIESVHGVVLILAFQILLIAAGATDLAAQSDLFNNPRNPTVSPVPEGFVGTWKWSVGRQSCGSTVDSYGGTPEGGNRTANSGLKDTDNLELAITVEDPLFLKEPFTFVGSLQRTKDTPIGSWDCDPDVAARELYDTFQNPYRDDTTASKYFQIE
jgi:hypothetical protein